MMTNNMVDTQVLRYKVIGTRRLTNYAVATAVTIGGVGFFLAGMSSYFKVDLLPTGNAVGLIFIPQGIALSFYGTAGLLLALYLWLSIAWNVGSGYNEFNRELGKVRIFRKGRPGKDKTIDLSYSLDAVQAVRVKIRDGINPQRVIYLKVKGRNDIPLTEVGQPLPIETIETQAAEIARFVGVPMEGL
ncbi:MAG: photosystem I assembly protein Ycf4 [Acaryochloridaceae cyanobacterium CSU_5_19]|nr:photosystem I assembly protein Ycf4 [Acaryochloridaceae cyanobacterium CSU_5_19]